MPHWFCLFHTVSNPSQNDDRLDLIRPSCYVHTRKKRVLEIFKYLRRLFLCTVLGHFPRVFLVTHLSDVKASDTSTFIKPREYLMYCRGPDFLLWFGSFTSSHTPFFLQQLFFLSLPVGCRVRRDIQIEANMKQRFIWLKVNKTGFIPLFRNEANRWILHAKWIKTEANISF